MRASGQWVVDASVALKWYLRDEEFLTQADGFLEAFSSGLATLAAPHFIRYEIANGLIVACRQGRLTPQQLNPRLQSFWTLNIGPEPDEQDVLLLAVELAMQLPVAFYDSLYLALARRHGYNFVTADRQLYERSKDTVTGTVWIGDLEA